ncbi:hypothetical protein DRE_01495 [Drechslerella stenobrocha 248]|uniref:F-box domain-containing protein n=1 Tax=Drechslerella stenobrocha 248 TaxID=1043628 RepID=W7HUU0_9PEZI|nr:hypothetical protein DRE_01495 [Drechslerella stenobrocha 248]
MAGSGLSSHSPPDKSSELACTDHEEPPSEEPPSEEHPGTLAPPYAMRPKLTLEGMPLEIILDIACHLPDARSAIKLSCVSREIYLKVAGSQYFWYRFGSRNLARFRAFKNNYDYHKYVIKAVSGQIAGTCQICLEPRTGSHRAGLKKNICARCMYENVIATNTSDETPIRRLPANHPILEVNLKSFIVYFPQTTGIYVVKQQKVCYWLPAFKKEAEAIYGCPWEQLTYKFLDNIRPLVSPKSMQDYSAKLYGRIRIRLLEVYTVCFHNSLNSVITLQGFEDLADRHQNSIKAKAEALRRVAPAEGQTDLANDDWIDATVNDIFDDLLGPRIVGYPQVVRNYKASPAWDIIEDGLVNWLHSAGRRSGRCARCQKRKSPHYFTFRAIVFDAPSFVVHVQQYHPDRLLALDSRWHV